jgi:hypothetical protein
VELTAEQALQMLDGHRGERVLVAIEPRSGSHPPIQVEGVLTHWRDEVRNPPPADEPDPTPGSYFVSGVEIHVTGLSASTLGGAVPSGLAFHFAERASLTITWG